MTQSTNTERRHITHKVIVSEEGVRVEPIGTPTRLPKYGKNPFEQ